MDQNHISKFSKGGEVAPKGFQLALRAYLAMLNSGNGIRKATLARILSQPRLDCILVAMESYGLYVSEDDDGLLWPFSVDRRLSGLVRLLEFPDGWRWVCSRCGAPLLAGENGSLFWSCHCIATDRCNNSFGAPAHTGLEYEYWSNA